MNIDSNDRQADGLVNNEGETQESASSRRRLREEPASSLRRGETSRDKVRSGRRGRGEEDTSVITSMEVEPWPKEVSGDLLMAGIAKLLTRFVVLPKWSVETLALWILHTYAFQLRDVTTYIGVESPEKRCGKTTLLTVLSELVNRPVVAANISSSAFFRVIEEVRPTLLIDEADTFLQGNDELRGILNSGYKRKTAFVVRVTNERQLSRLNDLNELDEEEPETASRLARFSSWCPKVMAAIGRLPETLADRCIVIRMHRKTTREECERLRNLETVDVRQQCARFVLDNARMIAAARPGIPEGLNDRAADIWEPLFALADLAGGPWPESARQAALALTSSAEEANPISSLLADILLTFVLEEKDRVFTRTMVDHLNRRSVDRPWLERRNGKPVTDLWLAQQLRPYGIRPRTLWIGEEQAKGYYREDFDQTFRRYIVKSEAKAYVDELKARSRSQPTATEGANEGEG